MVNIYVGYFTETQITAKIEAITAAIDIVLSGGKQYNLNDGQGSQSVTRESLYNLNKSLDYWLAKFDDLSSGSGVLSLQVGR